MIKRMKAIHTEEIDHVDYQHKLEKSYEIYYEADEETGAVLNITEITELPRQTFDEVKYDSLLWQHLVKTFEPDGFEEEQEDEL
tara:strand:+ start:1216 stop:1467 length:252 start_codon:yes stop_codon:yes gene_type:complete